MQFFSYLTIILLFYFLDSCSPDAIRNVEDPIGDCKAFSAPTNADIFSLSDTDLTFLEEATNFAKQEIKSDANIELSADSNSYLQKNSGLQLANGAESNFQRVDITLSRSGMPLCLKNVTIGKINEDMYLFGDMDEETEILEKHGVVSRTDALSFLRKQGIADGIDGSYLQLNSEDLCLWKESGAYVRARSFSYDFGSNKNNSFPFIAYIFMNATGVTAKIVPQSFDAYQGYINLRKNQSGSEAFTYARTKVDLGNLIDSKLLCNSRFLTSLAHRDSNNNFFYDSGDIRFAETTIFYNATAQAEWLSKNSQILNWPGPQILLQLDQPTTGAFGTNAAGYLPGAVPRIKLGAGNNETLKNLWFDSEVVQHEVNHHLVYQRLKNMKDESLVLHEALADFFVFAHTNNACLGETICPQNSTLCNSSSCLRSAENKLEWGQNNLPTEAHERSQLISGFLWDLRDKIELANITQIVLHAISLFPRDAGYKDFLETIYVSTKFIAGAKHQDFVGQTLAARGFCSIAKTSAKLKSLSACQSAK